MMPLPVARAAVPDDAAAISAVIVTTLRISNAADYPPDVIMRVAENFTPEAVLGMIAQRRVLVACAGDRIVGTGALDDDAVRSVFVLPEMQGRGIGAGLVAEIVAMAERSGQRRLRLHASLTARGFYERLSFHAVGEAVFGEERTIVMERDLGVPLAQTREM